MTTSRDPAPGLNSAQKRALLAELLLKQRIDPRPPLCWDLSYGQQAMWFLYQLAPQNPAYNVAFTARIVSEPDTPALRRVFQSLVNRHPMLRTTFSAGDEHPVQYVHAHAEVTFEQVDATGWNQAELQHRVEVAHQRPFDLERGPVFRVALFTRAPAEHVLLLDAHHIVMDGWTMNILLEEFRVLYSAEVEGLPARLLPLSAQYVDFVRAQTDMLRGPQGDRLRAYWHRQLAPPLPTLALPTDRPRPPFQTFRGATLNFQFDEALTGRLKGLARTEHTTIYTVLLAAFAALLHRWSGQDDLIIGSPTAGRDRAAFAGVVGDFFDMQVVRADCSGDPTFRALLGRVRQTVLDMLEHHGYPFTALMGHLRVEHDPSRSPVYQVGFDLQRLPSGRTVAELLGPEGECADIGGLTMQSFPIPQLEGQLDLMVNCVEVGGRILGGFKYSTDLFDAESIERLAQDFHLLVAAIVADVDHIVTAIPLSAPRELDLTAFLSNLQRLDIKLRLDGDRLRVNAPTGKLTAELQDEIGHRKSEIVDLLQLAQGTVLGSSVAQRHWLSGDWLDKQLAYWSRKLTGPLPVLDLPTDNARPATRSARGASHVLLLDSTLVDALSAFSQGEVATLFMCLLAAFKTLLYRLTRQEDILVGTPVAGRNQEEAQGLVGPFINNLVLRTDLSGDPTFRELLARVRTVTLEALAHQDVPFDMLLETLQPERDPSWPPLFQVLFSLENVLLPEPEFSGLNAEVVHPSNETSRFDLTFEHYQRATGLEVQVEYSTDLFQADTIRRLASQYEILLRAVVAYPDAHISTLPLLADPERQQLILDWNSTRREYRHEAGVHQMFEDQTARARDAVAVVFEDDSVTYGELNRRSNQLARHLQQLGVGPETLVGVYMERSIDMVVALLGILKAGGAYLPLDPSFPSERLAFMLEDSQARGIVMQQRLAGRIATGNAMVVQIDADWPLVAQQRAENLPEFAAGERLAYVLYTSGSTGRPKGVQVLHRGVVNFLTTMRERPGLSAEDIMLSVTTLSFDIAGLEIFLPLSTGARVVLVSSRVAADGAALLNTLRRTRATVMQATPATWRLLLAAGWERIPQLRVLCGGEALSAELAAQMIARADSVWNLYGPTETTIWSTIHPVAPGEASIPIGRPIANTRVYVLDQRLEPVPVGIPGELYIGGDGVARGYLNQPELTLERFLTDPFSHESNARMYRTGDLVRWRADQNLEYLERVDTQVKIRGYRIELGEIEALLEHEPSVRQAVVVVREDTPGDKRLLGYVVPEQPDGVSVEALTDRLKQNLPAYMVPTLLVSLDRLPLTPNGKVDRKALPTPAAEDRPQRSRPAIQPRTQVERDIARIWCDVLKLEEVGVSDNFFDLGGHSLLILQVHNRIRQAFKSDLSVAQMFQYPTVEALARQVQRPVRAEASMTRAHERGHRLRLHSERLRQSVSERPADS